jgi:hypothetical protein
LSDLDATGKFGNQLTKKLNHPSGQESLSGSQVINLFEEDGQVFELNLEIRYSSWLRIVIRDGSHIDILGEGDRLPGDILGLSEEMSLSSWISPKN